ncbi:hypothetical protein [Nonomuraea bangladeshensis]|uniref:hypothetical protein n=2 Tax=Nonomuraea TaxID=83681 RepID=UPI0031CEBF40
MRTQADRHPVRKILGLLALATATGCVPTSPAAGGVTGITVNAEGRMAVVAAWCQEPPDGVIIYRRVNGDLVDQADLKAPKLSGTTASLDLERIPPGWSLLKGDLNFRPGQKYVAGAYNATSHARMADVTFTNDTKEKITAGSILVQNHAEHHPDGVDALLSAAEFTARAQHYC